jgi:sugar/nucleoside kinase (ribokinase family)
MNRKFDLLVIGEINPDLIVRGKDVVPEFGQAEKLVEEAQMTLGSSSVITACGAVRLGLNVAFIGLVGEDQFGHFMLESMQKRGIDVNACLIDATNATGMSVILSTPDDRAILTYPGTIPSLRRDQIDESLFLQARHLHIGSYFLLDALHSALPSLLRNAKEKGMTTSLDTNWDPSGRWDLSAVLPHVDVLFPNRNEVQYIAGKEDFLEAVNVMALQVPTLAIKLGAQGGLARRGDKMATAPALGVEVMDTTGAGDSFNAGFLYGQLNNFTLEESLVLACACGSLSTRSVGGTAAQPTLSEAQATIQGQSDKTR